MCLVLCWPLHVVSEGATLCFYRVKGSVDWNGLTCVCVCFIDLSRLRRCQSKHWKRLGSDRRSHFLPVLSFHPRYNAHTRSKDLISRYCPPSIPLPGRRWTSPADEINSKSTRNSNHECRNRWHCCVHGMLAEEKISNWYVLFQVASPAVTLHKNLCCLLNVCRGSNYNNNLKWVVVQPM